MKESDMQGSHTTTPHNALSGRHIIITRPREQADDFALQLEAAGARVTIMPTIKIAPLETWADVDDCVNRLASFDWIVFTSVNGVRAFARRLDALHATWDRRGRARIAAIGPATATALEEQGVTVDMMPTEYVAEAVADGLGNVAGQHILLLRADIARRTLAEDLRLRGAEVEEVAVYRTVSVPAEEMDLAFLLSTDRPDAITFTSSSTVRGFIDSVTKAGYEPRHALHDIALAAIGPITATTLREYGLEPVIVAEEYTTQGILQALRGFFSSTR